MRGRKEEEKSSFSPLLRQINEIVKKKGEKSKEVSILLRRVRGGRAVLFSVVRGERVAKMKKGSPVKKREEKERHYCVERRSQRGGGMVFGGSKPRGRGGEKNDASRRLPFWGKI